MRFTAARRERWKRAAESALTLIVLSGVVVGGITHFGSRVLGGVKGTGDAEQSLGSIDTFAGLVDLGGPAAAVTRFAIQKEEAESSLQRANNEALLVRNWRYTQSPTTGDLVVVSLSLYVQAIRAEAFLAAFDNFFDPLQTALAANPSPLAQFVSNVLDTFHMLVDSLLTAFVNAAANLQSFINSFLPPALRPPPIPPASPCGC